MSGAGEDEKKPAADGVHINLKVKSQVRTPPGSPFPASLLHMEFITAPLGPSSGYRRFLLVSSNLDLDMERGITLWHG
jgi:hypothetical protein